MELDLQSVISFKVANTVLQAYHEHLILYVPTVCLAIGRFSILVGYIKDNNIALYSTSSTCKLESYTAQMLLLL